jgi:Domain of unknown function (DUF4267)
MLINRSERTLSPCISPPSSLRSWLVSPSSRSASASFWQPRRATLAFGVAADNLRALTEIKGVRDISSGAVLLVVWAAAGGTALGWGLLAAALTPTADAMIVLTNGGKLSTGLGIHGLTAGLLVAAGLVLALG